MTPSEAPTLTFCPPSFSPFINCCTARRSVRSTRFIVDVRIRLAFAGSFVKSVSLISIHTYGVLSRLNRRIENTQSCTACRVVDYVCLVCLVLNESLVLSFSSVREGVDVVIYHFYRRVDLLRTCYVANKEVVNPRYITAPNKTNNIGCVKLRVPSRLRHKSCQRTSKIPSLIILVLD